MCAVIAHCKSCAQRCAAIILWLTAATSTIITLVVVNRLTVRNGRQLQNRQKYTQGRSILLPPGYVLICQICRGVGTPEIWNLQEKMDPRGPRALLTFVTACAVLQVNASCDNLCTYDKNKCCPQSQSVCAGDTRGDRV